MYKSGGLNPYPNKYSYVTATIAFGQGIGGIEATRYLQMWPPVLKCFITGTLDQRMTQTQLHELMIYYCHRRKFDPDYEENVRKSLERRGVTADNAQERFLFNLDGGKHALHLQKKMQPQVKQIIAEYLSVLEEIN